MTSKKSNQNHTHHHQKDSPHSLLPSDPELRVKAIESLLLNKGLIDPKSIEEIIDLYQNKIGPRNGAKVVVITLKFSLAKPAATPIKFCSAMPKSRYL